MVLGKRDFYGNSIVYETDGESFSLRSAGPDETLNSEDDLLAGPFYTSDEALEIEQTIEEETLEEEFDFK